MKLPDSVGAVILAGGLGKRLRNCVSDRQKAVAEVDGKPFAAHLLSQLRAAGLRRVTLACGHRAESVARALTEYADLTLSIESEPLDTGGALALALDRTPGDPILAMNGDSYLELDFGAFFAAFQNSGLPAMLAACRVEDLSRYGALELDADGRVVSFREKGAERGAGLINGGVYLFARETLAALPRGRALSLERELFPKLAAARKLGAFTGGGRFIDIGVPESYRLAQSFFHPIP